MNRRAWLGTCAALAILVAPFRETYFTFRGKDSTNSDDFRLHRWEDMELNELLYAGGEVVKLWLYPRGPDSGFKVFPGAGSRFTYFDTTATTHALNEPAWIVRELADDELAVPNGLPVFPIYYTNDDEASRQLGKDSQITFAAKSDGRYLIRVRDARGQSGDNYKYKLSLRSLIYKWLHRRLFRRLFRRLHQQLHQERDDYLNEFFTLIDMYNAYQHILQDVVSLLKHLFNGPVIVSNTGWRKT